MDGATQSALSRAGLGRPSERVVDGPQLLTFLAQQVGSLHELRARLVQVNRAVRGIVPPPPSDSNKSIEKEPELNLANITKALSYVIEQCHAELNETSALLT
jgi:hypothetical protein